MITVRRAKPSDAAAWLQLRHALWPEGSEAEHREEIDRFFAGEAREPLAVLLAEDGAGCPVGFAELSIRGYAEGCRSDRVAYLEGWFVVPKARGGGVGRALMVAAEEWGRAQGCHEFASDAEADNEVNAAAHRALGFVEVGLVRCFRKTLTFAALLAAIAPHSILAQTPDTTQSRVPRSFVLFITTPSLIAVVSPSDTARFRQVLASGTAVAESLGFTPVVRTTPLQQIVDRAHAAVYYVPRSFAVGYLIIAPSRRPDAIPTLISADSLRIRLLAYKQLVRHLPPNPD